MNHNNNITRVVIVGGGTAGWMTAAALSKVLGGAASIRLIESDDIGTIGVGESTIPMLRLFNALLGIDEDEFMRQTQATFKLGIELRDWGRIGDRYMHGFGPLGQNLATLSFHQYWLRMHQAGKARDLEAYSINRMAAKAHRFTRADRSLGNSPLADVVHAFHIDAGLYARYLRRFAEAAGVRRTEGKVVDVALRAEDGFVEAVRMDGGERIEGDLFIDCSGLRGLLIEQALHTGYEEWTPWLPCDRAVVVPCESTAELPPYTIATARPAGWQWRIGLQHRTGNGHVYSSAHMSEDEATTLLMDSLDGRPLADPRTLHFTSGQRAKVWNRNVVAIGLASGFAEPLESTSIHLIQSTIARLIAFFPDREFRQVDVGEFNRQCRFETERIRDFLILHYHATERDDSPFWDDCRTMDVPDTLQHKLDLWRSAGRIVRNDNELFAEVGWLQVLHGQRVQARAHHPVADVLAEADVASYLGNIEQVIANCVEQMPTHAQFVKAHSAGVSIAT
jgi:tryptophan halogenase